MDKHYKKKGHAGEDMTLRFQFVFTTLRSFRHIHKSLQHWGY
jgi:hypothetical protein